MSKRSRRLFRVWFQGVLRDPLFFLLFEAAIIMIFAPLLMIVIIGII